jgi:hypothetical protein
MEEARNTLLYQATEDPDFFSIAYPSYSPELIEVFLARDRNIELRNNFQLAPGFE